MKFFLLIIFCLTFFPNPADPRRMRNLLKIAKIPEPQNSIPNYKAVFNRVDFVIDYEIDDQIVQIEVFKSSSNDQIIQSADSQNYDKLAWFSLGYPNLVDFHRNSSIFNRFGFNLNVELLNNQIRDKICQMILQRYKIEVEPSQIFDVVPCRFNCGVILLDQNNKMHKIEGSGFDMRKSPFFVNFDALQNTTKRLLFEQYFYSNQDLIIQCNFEAESVETKISGDDFLSVYDVLERNYLIKIKNFQFVNSSVMTDLFRSQNINTVLSNIERINIILNTIPSNRIVKFSSGVFDGHSYGCLGRFSVNFSQSFNEPPKVLYSIKKINFDGNHPTFNYKILSESISAQGMIVDIEVGFYQSIFHTCRVLYLNSIHVLEIHWFAIGF